MAGTAGDEGAVLITGTSSGIGLHCAIAAARAGYRVVATVRRVESLTAVDDRAHTAQVSLDVRLLDVTSDESVHDCVEKVLQDYGSVHALVNNAGGGHLGTLEQDSMAELRAVCELNFFGVARVTRAVLPHLRACRGRLITVSSVGGVVGQPFNDAYCAAKFAVEGLMESLAPVAAAVGVRVSVIEPGAVATEFVHNAGVPSGRLTEDGPYRELLDRYLSGVAKRFTEAQPADEVAELVLDVLCSPQPAFRYQTTPLATRFTAVKLTDVTGTGVQELTSGWLS